VSKARRKITRLVLLAVSALGLCSTIILLTDPPPADLETTSSIFTINSSVITRNISSINSSDAVPSSETLLNLNCSDPNQTYETSSTRLRLKGESCVDDGQPALTTQVRNKTNGYVATVFHRSPMAFTTDYINLREGSNEIDVKFQSEKGIIARTVTIVRQPASKAQN
jgi:hypothetical protein